MNSAGIARYPLTAGGDGSAHLLAALVPLRLPLAAFDVYCLIDLIRACPRVGPEILLRRERV